MSPGPAAKWEAACPSWQLDWRQVPRHEGHIRVSELRRDAQRTPTPGGDALRTPRDLAGESLKRKLCPVCQRTLTLWETG